MSTKLFPLYSVTSCMAIASLEVLCFDSRGFLWEAFLFVESLACSSSFCLVFAELQKISIKDNMSSNSMFMLRICFENSIASNIPPPADDGIDADALVPESSFLPLDCTIPLPEELALIAPEHGTCSILLISFSYSNAN